MKTIAILLVSVAVASAFTINHGQQAGASAAASAGASATAGAAAGGAAAGGAAGNLGYIDYGPKVYGMGAKNPFAMPPNPFAIQRALQIVKHIPNTLVRIDMDGDIEITDQFGQEVDPVMNVYGRHHELEF